MFLGYNTNGLAHHSLPQAIALLADLGYRGVAITIDHYAMAPAAENLAAECRVLRRMLGQRQLRSVVETGARYLLDPRQKHEPTLLSADAEGRRRRIEFYRHAMRCAAELGSECVSLWSGVLREDLPRATAMQRLVDGLGEVLETASALGVVVAFEPEPGMFIDTLAAYDDLQEQLSDPRLRLTIDVGHLHCQGETPIADHLRERAGEVVNIHLEDMRAGVHEHLMFGEGEIAFPPIMEALSEIASEAGVYVELSRHSHVGPQAAQQAIEFLGPLVDSAAS
jgi:sugar phosphate isomerase/epimerase